MVLAVAVGPPAIPNATRGQRNTENDMATLNGTAGDDFLRGTPMDDHILGLEGNDRLVGLWGDDWLSGDRSATPRLPFLTPVEPVAYGNDLLDGGAGTIDIFLAHVPLT
jgi:Ca2+-binding RTX toxin-like protein